ncbi:carboxypeptidase M32 [Corallincola holothuriorum]|uniref:Metal-dependent carboxypeptidase n=1 Tax=Corallincola holothuriorum TaxID=2282215 RepID=A0A368NN18_9GAMM|nr:carboxypeptidase M32 [Corallincola holothuriorum]RCU51480.1 carboxypeptidase M32 [Corallincola holothuriorum]
MNKPYQWLEARFNRLSQLAHFNHLANWDQATQMPSGGAAARGEAMAELSLIRHELLTATEVAEQLAMASGEALTAIQQANLRAMQRQYDLSVAVPGKLVRAKTQAAMAAENAWRQLRPANNWTEYAPILKNMVDLVREEADARVDYASKQNANITAGKAARYDQLIDLYEPGCSSAFIAPIFARLKQTLPALINQVSVRQASQPLMPLPTPLHAEKQFQLARGVSQKLGFDFERGRMDLSHHPFCGGVPDDIRITSRFDPNDLFDGLMSTIHETGHALYEAGLPKSLRGQPVGEAQSTGLHESQSLLFEMQLARTPEFVSFLQPQVEQNFGSHSAFASDNLYRHITRVSAGHIRVAADELTYPMHIILRYEIEQALMLEQIEVADIPALWDEKMQQYLGVATLGNDKDGCMQDVHWAAGEFGYFPTYTLGALYAAQLTASLRKTQPDFGAAIAQGDFGSIKHWLSQHVWQHGGRYTTEQIITMATGEPLNPDFFVNHLKRRYLDE